jgi:hypothetical protein
MKLEETMQDGFMILTDGKRTLELDLSSWGNANVYIDGMQIPSSRIWELVLDALESKKRVDRPTLFAEAERASMYAQATTHMLLWTLNPNSTRDERLRGNVYWHRDMTRMRPLMEKLDLVAGKLSPSAAATAKNLEELFDVAAEHGLYPVGGADNKYYFSKNPDDVYRRLQCKPSAWMNIIKLARRPGQHGYKVDLTRMQ